MSRPKRIQYKGALYHIFNRGNARRTVFFSESHYDKLLELLYLAKLKFNIECHAYCFMKNHYHLMISTPNGNITQAMHFVGSHLGRAINQDLNSEGPLFKGRFQSILVDSDTYFLRLSRYIHLNPVKAKLVNHPKEYVWSSFKYYDGTTQAPRCLSKKRTLSYFKNRNEYSSFVEMGIDEELDAFYSKKNISKILGSAQFKQKALTI
ncbi:transposase [bacterium]|jgi:putative transposase|nr:transposase [bacterium]